MAQFFRTRFDNRGLGKTVKRIVAPVSVIHVSDLELVLPYTHNHEFVTLLESYYRFNPGFPFWPWHGHRIHPRCAEYHVFSR